LVGHRAQHTESREEGWRDDGKGGETKMKMVIGALMASRGLDNSSLDGATTLFGTLQEMKRGSIYHMERCPQSPAMDFYLLKITAMIIFEI
jgi:hypothetical protein